MTVPSDPHAEKRAQIVAAARELFMVQGYGATSMSAIAARIGGSKTTLWLHFRNKAEVFAAVVDDVAARYDSAAFDLAPDLPVAETLTLFASALLATEFSAPILEMRRLVASEAARHPDIVRHFHDRGPGRVEGRLAERLRRAMETGALRSGDPQEGAAQFVALCLAGSYRGVLHKGEAIPPPETIARDIRAAVDTFTRSWSALGT